MGRPCRWLLCWFFWFWCCCWAIGEAEREAVKNALIMLKSGIVRDPSGVLSAWGEEGNYCGWRGVVCNGEGEEVVALDLTGASLSGTIQGSAFVGNSLSGLKKLNLGSNNFSGEIPEELAELGELEELRLDHNSLVGIIPGAMAKLLNLTKLDLSYNMLSGEIPGTLPFTAFSEEAYAGNRALCGAPLALCEGF